ncbi:DUF3040 domain-containing protein [Actinoplanes friuliensis]|uniref:DUF3040 domain-containing protein n=1 Tax=Actinoplanes friuliensis DSM 7358 TaxID=1246995 RepID=U5VZJ7_9ACTN|nr:DUF3040 domain-containing protein [Actinoplanes friuliensis]AGZ41135.1 hypothetical protein AFR_14265 [Actinoplanes friuliensis DSM 7358]
MGDDERLTLRAIEQNLIRTDPEFAARMRAPALDSPRFPWVTALCILTYIFVPIQALLFGWVSAVITLDVVAVVLAGILIRRRRRAS